MRGVCIKLENRPGALAEMEEALGRAGVSVEGGGGFVISGAGMMHFLFKDGYAARKALEAAHIDVIYSDHESQLILVVDKQSEGRAVSEAWETERRQKLAEER